MCSGMAYYIQGFVTRERGPVFVTSFSPLCMIITAALGTIILSEQIYVGRYVYVHINTHNVHFCIVLSES